MIRVAINGFGRIGRNFLRALILDNSTQSTINVVAINCGPGAFATLAHLFKYDSVMGIFPGTVILEDDTLIINKSYRIKLFAVTDAHSLPWQPLDIDWVVDCSGKFTQQEQAQLHKECGARNVLISAPTHGEDITIIPGINHTQFSADKHSIVSLGSCTTNALVPIVATLNKAFEIQQGCMTTVHAYTSSQSLLDMEKTDMRRARAAALNIIPTTTGATKVVDKIIPELTGKIFGCAVRVPVAKVSLIDLVIVARKSLSAQTINQALEAAAKDSLKNILNITYEPLVSSDFSGNSSSVVVDGLLTQDAGTMGKIFGWYDNEWGYSQRLKDFLMFVGTHHA